MALISRVCSLSNYKCKYFLISSVVRFSTYDNTYRALSSVRFSQNISPIQRCYKSTTSESKKSNEIPNVEVVTGNKPSQKIRLKQAIRDYGATIVVFHVAISLVSLGICYIAISNGVNVVDLFSRFNFSESMIANKLAVGGSTFVMAYAVHKVLAPLRITITVTAAPFIVRYLRKMKLIKPPK